MDYMFPPQTQGSVTVRAEGRQVQLKIWLGEAGASQSVWINLDLASATTTIAALIEHRDAAQAHLDALPIFAATYPTETEQAELGLAANQLLVTNLDDEVLARTEPVPGRTLGNAISALQAAGYEIVDSMSSSIDGSLEYSVRAL